jgi:hypothetical protein
LVGYVVTLGWECSKAGGIAVFKRETYRLGLKRMTRTIDSTDPHTMLFTPVGDQLDANDDLHGDLGTAIAVLKS